MAERPYILLSCGVSIDGYLDNASQQAAAAVQPGRPRPRRRRPGRLRRHPGRRPHGPPGQPAADRPQPGLPRRAGGARACRRRRPRSTVTAGARLDPSARFFTTGHSDKLVYCASDAVPEAPRAARRGRDRGRRRPPVRMARLSEDLHDRGTRRLMVEGGGSIHTQFLTAGLADELHLVVAPFFVGDSRAPPLRRRRPVPVEPGPAREAGRGTPPRRRRAAPLRAVLPVRGRMTRPVPPPARIRTQVSIPLRFGDGFTTTARAFTFEGLVDGGEHLAFRLGTAAAEPSDETPTAGPRAQRVPHRRRVRQRPLRLRPAAARVGRAGLGGRRAACSTCARRVAASGSTPSSTPTPSRTRASTPTRPTSRSGFGADERDYTVAAQMLHALGVRRVALLTNNPDKAAPAEPARHRGDPAACPPACTSGRPTPPTSPPR